VITSGDPIPGRPELLRRKPPGDGEPKRRAPRVPTRCQLEAAGKGQAGPGGQGAQAIRSGGPGAGVQELLHLVRDPPSRQGSEEGPLHEIPSGEAAKWLERRG
jgi:hypothetical protein